MKIDDFLLEWGTFCAAPTVSALPIEERLELFEQWVSIRKDVAAVRAKNKLWADLIGTLVDAAKSQLIKLTVNSPEEAIAKDAINELISKLEEAMKEHRQQTP